MKRSMLLLGLSAVLLSSCKIYSTGQTPFKQGERITVEVAENSRVKVKVKNYSDSTAQLFINSEEVSFPASASKKFLVSDEEKIVIINRNKQVRIQVSFIMFFRNRAYLIRERKSKG